MYVFLQVRFHEHKPDNWRELRLSMLEVACGVARNRFPNLKTVIGIAMDPLMYSRVLSEDFLRLDCDQWSEEQREYYDTENKKFNFLTNPQMQAQRIFDFN